MSGNMWAQEWTHIFDLVKPYPQEESYDLSKSLRDQDYDVYGLFKMADDFFQSLGMEPMTETFWRKSMMVRPKDREVECHASAEDFFKEGDYR